MIIKKNPLVENIKKLLRWISERQIILNVFKSNHKKRALIVYTIYPFKNSYSTHSNAQETRSIAKILDDLGFVVDVCHYTTNRKIDYTKYSLLFGFGVPFENSFSDIFLLKRIYYATGAHVFHQNHAELNRISQVNDKYGLQLLPKRLIPWTWSQSTTLSDLLIVVGNSWTKSTYAKFTKTAIEKINVTALINEKTKYIHRNISDTRNRFIWFGSKGSIHKGLDLCIELISTVHTNLELHICGPYEEDFFEAFEQNLKSKNIIFHGFVDVNSDKYIEIISRCTFALLPTCSEGQATSLLTVMAAGVIPISTIYSGLDLEKVGIIIKTLDTNGLNNAINEALTFTDDIIIKKSQIAQRIVAQNHSIDSYQNTMKKIIKKAINNEK